MEEKTNSIMPFYFPKDHKSIVSIIGIGGGAGRIVNKMQACRLTDTELSIFGMNRKEMEELSLPNKYRIGGRWIRQWKGQKSCRIRVPEDIAKLRGSTYWQNTVLFYSMPWWRYRRRLYKNFSTKSR